MGLSINREKVIKGLELLYDRLLDAAKRDAIAMLDASMVANALALLKEQEAVEPKTGNWIFESAYCEAWSHTCSECGKRMTTAYNTYAKYCWNCGTKMKVGEAE